MKNQAYLNIAQSWFGENSWEPFPFQLQTWEAYLNGEEGIVNAPTGSGKTYSLIIPILLESIQAHSLTSPVDRANHRPKEIQAILITPIRALAKEIKDAANRAIEGLGLQWEVGIRSGDTSNQERTKQKNNPPQILITTPESLHLLLARKGYPKYFKSLKTIVVDEWHELLGSKRGVQMELAISRLKNLLPSLKVWGISATIGNMEIAQKVLLPWHIHTGNARLIQSHLHKKIVVKTILPEEIEKFPWAGHLGIKLLEKVLPLIHNSTSTLIFTNTRAQCEIWYQKLLDVDPDLAGVIAMHHGSISRELRNWVENALHGGQIKAVVCTSSLDLGVDFRPVETIIQIGSPKGVARFMQRAGRSGHQPGATSKIFFVPTHSLELIEGSALRKAVELNHIESRTPYLRSFDVLIQYLMTLAVSEGFQPREIFQEIKKTFSYQSISDQEWNWILNFLKDGGSSLQAYDEYKKITVDESGRFLVEHKGIALRHRLSIGTIVGDESLIVKFVSGKKIGSIEEWFIAQLKPGDTFWFAGRSLELVRIKGMEVQVRKSKKKTGKIPSWMGGRMSFSSELAHFFRIKVNQLKNHQLDDEELKKLEPLVYLQEKRSAIPGLDELLLEYFQSREGYHLIIYPFEGHYVHEGMGTLLAFRLSRMMPISFSIAKNDYGFELLSDQPIPIKEALETDLFSPKNLTLDIQNSINSVEMARRQFRDIASISGLVFKGYPNKPKKEKHLQSSSQLFFDVFKDYEPDNLLFLQAFDEVMNFQLEEIRLRKALKRIESQKILFMEPHKATPFAFPIMIDRLREKLSSEKLIDRIKKMKLQLER